MEPLCALERGAPLWADAAPNLESGGQDGFPLSSAPLCREQPAQPYRAALTLDTIKTLIRPDAYDAQEGSGPPEVCLNSRVRTCLSERTRPLKRFCLCSGLELLLDEIYDTIFAGLDLASTFTETTLYRILQRRFLAVQLLISGRFRCK